ncbi:ABC-2 transporter permease [Microbacterium lushaniae]|nr:ABC-2 transporter permease [Microbacterium lushaniae]KAA9159227.1 ABC-2 transporter permease [Microbacterium lushaniae]
MRHQRNERRHPGRDRTPHDADSSGLGHAIILTGHAPRLVLRSLGNWVPKPPPPERCFDTALSTVPGLMPFPYRLDTLYGVLPVSRRAIVVGRALSILVYGVVALIVATVATLVVAAVRGTPLAPELLAIAYAAALAIVGLSIGVQLPVLFRVGYSRGRFMVYAPTILIVGAAWIVQASGVIDGVVLGSIPFALGLGICATIGVLGIVVGTLIAVRLYSTRELR